MSQLSGMDAPILDVLPYYRDCIVIIGFFPLNSHHILVFVNHFSYLYPSEFPRFQRSSTVRVYPPQYIIFLQPRNLQYDAFIGRLQYGLGSTHLIQHPRVGVSPFVHQPPKVEDVERGHRQDDRRTIERIERIEGGLSRDDPPRPSIRKFYRSVDGADEHPDGRMPCAEEN